ncbi:MAG: BrxE family protein [Chloroflexia bacterium]|nr:BrxE family protein [Chloroflexia bacterium]
MDVPFFASLAQLRAAVGFLGERDQYGWWPSGFLSAGSRPFLAPIFGRTLLLAQCVSVTRAAALVHDERIGIGRVFHLFRLPEDSEQGLHQVLHDPQVGQQIAALGVNADTALAFLQREAQGVTGNGVGPTQVGSVHALGQRALWRMMAAQYAHAFSTGTQVYPYVVELV